MASKKDLIEAQAYSRKRLLTAFTSGAPGGKELEPASPLRAVVAGIALAVMVVVGGVFYGLMKPGLGKDWENNTLVMVTDTGARYLAMGGTLYPIVNATSARLLVPAGEFSILATDSSSIRGVPVGNTIGILGAPDDVPAVGNLIGAGWTACVAEGGTAVSLPGDDLAVQTDGGIVVRSEGQRFVVAGGYRYPVAAEHLDSVLRAVGLADARVLDVDARWLNLFDAGEELAPLHVDRAGEIIEGTALIIGTVLQPQGSQTRFLVTPEGTLESLSPLDYQMYLLGTGTLLGSERAVAPGEISALPNAQESLTGENWPEDQLVPVPVSMRPCATLTHDARNVPVSTLSATTSADAGPGVSVALRSGALVAAGGGGDQAARFVHLIDESGTSYPLPDADEELLARLGYAATNVSNVSSAWMQFFASGPALTTTAAGSSPQTSPAAQGDALVTPPTTSAPAPSASPSPGLALPSPSPNPSIAVDAAMPGQCERGVVTWIPTPPQALSLMQSIGAWDRSTGEGIVVAVVDSGIDTSNPHLTEAVVGGINLVPDGQAEDGSTDLSGHGTAIAGIIAARTVEGSGVIGLAPHASLLAVRVYSDTSDKSVEAGFGPTPGRVAEGIRWAVDQGADVINVSLSVETDFPEVRAAVEYAYANNVLVVASGGNRATSSNTADSPRYPGAYPQALAVSAADSRGRVTSASIHGPHIDVSAPGISVVTAMADGGDCTYATDAPSASYATAYVSAAAALVRFAHPHESVEELSYRLTASAVRDHADARDDQAGWGLVQPLDAMTMVIGSDVKGPEAPFMGQSPIQEIASSEALSSVTVEPAIAPTQRLIVLISAAAAIAVATIGVVLGYRSRDVVSDVSVERGPGLLGSMKGQATAITGE